MTYTMLKIHDIDAETIFCDLDVLESISGKIPPINDNSTAIPKTLIFSSELGSAKVVNMAPEIIEPVT